MGEDQERVGLGKVVYNVEANEPTASNQEQPEETAELEEADQESFPASDPPGFAGGKKQDPV